MSDWKIAVIGSGKIGRCWALLFAAAGYSVQMYDVKPEQLDSALSAIMVTAEDLKKEGLFRGHLSISELMANINTTATLADCVKNAHYVQECVQEDYELKKGMFKELDTLVTADQVLASSTSALPASEFSEGLIHKENCLVAHPVNPPIYCPLVELVPAPWTRPEAMERARTIMINIGQEPVTLKKEIVGFAVNRVQYAIVAECWRLVLDGVMSVEDVDKVVSQGLGMRWAFLGPLEVTALNGDGVVDHNKRYNRGFMKICNSFGPAPDLESPELLEQAQLQIESRLPLEKVEQRRIWRDKCLASLAKLKQQLDSQ